MILIIGGAYQGKLDFARARFDLQQEDIFVCDGAQIDFSKRCICSLEVFTRCCADPVAYFEENREKWQDSILILRDIFCGVVPMDAQVRTWRQETGRFAQYLGREATQVSRIFCGLEQRLK